MFLLLLDLDCVHGCRQTDSVVGSEAVHGTVAVLYENGKWEPDTKAQREDGWLSKLQMGGETRQLQTNKDGGSSLVRSCEQVKN